MGKGYIALLWHQHQPMYRDPLVRDRVSMRMPWVRLHAARDYYQMAHLVGEQPGMSLTINLTPVLLKQLEMYAAGARDRLMDLSLRDKTKLTPDECAEMINGSFDVNHRRQISGDRRYEELYEKLLNQEVFSVQELRDLAAIYNLSWIGQVFRDGPFTLETGDIIDLRDYFEKPEGFTEGEIEAIIDAQLKIAAAVIPLHKRLAEEDCIELSTTPFYHPILPLVNDSDEAIIDRPGTGHPPRFNRTNDAEAQVRLALDYFESLFGFRPPGMWPAEGAVGESILPLFADNGIEWIASDEGVLKRSGDWRYPTDDPATVLRAYSTSAEGLAIYFRNTRLSDDIGFMYQSYEDDEEAVANLVANACALCQAAAENSGDDAILSVILDGENCWGGYPKQGVSFLKALYRNLAKSDDLAPVTFSEYIKGNEERDIEPHPVKSLQRVDDLACASWIDEVGSAPGNDLGTWAGENEENRAWRLLGEARRAIDDEADGSTKQKATEYILIAEGSDWFWWLGDDHGSGSDAEFDSLFRDNLKAVYYVLGRIPPPELDEPITPRRVIWSEDKPVAPSTGDLFAVKWDKPGLVHFGVNGWQDVRDVSVKPTAGVMGSQVSYFVADLLRISGDIRSVEFTFRDAEGEWSGRDFRVEVGK
jgi:alpha-amylase/alpha-mannosidase (GH57 family)